MRPFLLYAVVRLGLWIAIWWLLTLLDIGVMLAGVLAALIAMLISILFLDRLRDAAAMRWKDAHERRVAKRGPVVDEDAEYEDSLFADDGDGAGNGKPAQSSADEDDAAAGPADLPELGDPETDATVDEQRADGAVEADGSVRGSDR
ncbi:DUF4229 domain-containing protein [Brachybacterium aquaticum]|uniref:DUF4229 domain-containing protein n=1 Tax=Brachybacterium aquaticum TaxID=1432564 RepID=A0A841AAF0_9MICO|nr:DUF4229 domain-containing protein [Brachybacterium aquaticum]MBB5830591.1 hypothetical protein [Brachybacterium aquaticum]